MNLMQKVIERPELLFAELSGQKPFYYQINFLKDKHKRINWRSGRQSGKTTSAAVKAIHHALNLDNALVLTIAPTLRQSGLLFRKIRTFIKNHHYLESLVEQDSQTTISFKNGSLIVCLPGNNPDSVRGFSPTLLIIDEAAFVKDDVFIALLPSLAATNGTLIYISTPFGKRGIFYESFNDDSFSHYFVKSKDCPLISEGFLLSMRNLKTELEYLQEYEGEFIEEADTFFTRQLILDTIGECPELEKANPSIARVEYYLGVDCARFGFDETVYTIIQKDQDVDGNYNYTIVYLKSTSKKPLTDIISRVQELHSKFTFRAIYMDESGLGSGAVDVLIEKGLPLRNLKGEGGISFTLESKEIMYNNLKLLMQQKKLIIPKNDKLIHQLSDLQYEYTEARHLKIHHSDGGRDDFPDSLALACLCSRVNEDYHFVMGLN